MSLEFVIARRDAVDAAIRQAGSLGLPVDFVAPTFDAGAGRASLDFLRAASAPRRPERRILNPTLACLALVLAGLLIYLPMQRDGRLAAALSARVDQLRNEARVAERLREEIAAERRNVLSVVTRKLEAPPFVRILDDLTRLIPDSAWVSRLDFRDGTIRAVMNAPESGSIVRLIEGSDRFSDARMVTAVRQIPVTGHEQFTLSFSAIKEAKR